MKSVREILTAARDLYAQAPSHVRFGAFPRPGTNCPVTAVQAIVRAEDRQTGESEATVSTALQALATVSDAISGVSIGGLRGSVIQWNAEASTDEVLATFDKAIAEAA